MDVFRAAEACCFFDLKATSEHREFAADPLSSEEFNYAMVSSTSDDEEDDVVPHLNTRRRNRFTLLESSDEEVSSDDDHYARVEVNDSSGGDLWSQVLNEVGGGGDAATLGKFSQVLPLVLKHAIIQDF